MVRYTLSEISSLKTFYSIKDGVDEMRASYSVWGGKVAPIITNRGLVMAEWGFISRWAPRTRKPFRIYLAQAESLSYSHSFSYAFDHNRCVIPVSNLYISEKDRGKKTSYTIQPTKGFLSVAGIYLKNESEEGTSYQFAMITVPAKKQSNQTTKRLPAVIPKQLVSTWVDLRGNKKGKLSKILLSYPFKSMAITKENTVKPLHP